MDASYRGPAQYCQASSQRQAGGDGRTGPGGRPPSKAKVKTHIKKSERTLRGTISGAVTNMNRLVTQQMTQAQYHQADPLVKELLTQVWEEYHGIVSKLEVTILSEGQASEEDTTLLTTTEEFLAWELPRVRLIRTKMVENMPLLE